MELALNYYVAGIGPRGAITGNYLWWNDSGFPPADQGMIWDLHLIRKVLPRSELSPELFLSARNLFINGHQALTRRDNSAPRWFEGGSRLPFCCAPCSFA